MVYNKKVKNLNVVNAEVVKAKYNCGQSTLFSILFYSWSNLVTYLTKVQLKFPIYTTDYIAEKRAKIGPVRDMPNEDQRQEEISLIENHLIAIRPTAISIQEQLNLYIKKAFKSEYKIRIEAAGYNYLVLLTKRDWESGVDMFNMGEVFITNNEAALLLNNNMPDTFKAAYLQVKNDYRLIYTNLGTAKSNKGAAANAKTTACNGLYDEMMEMFADAGFATKDDANIKKSFTFAAAKRYFDPSGVIVRKKELPANQTIYVENIRMHSVVKVEEGNDVWACEGSKEICSLETSGQKLLGGTETALGFDANNITFSNPSLTEKATIWVHIQRNT